MSWEPRKLRGNTVYARVRPSGELDVGADGRVDVRYRNEEGAKVYRAAARNLIPDGGPPPEGAIIFYTDGACSGNPGPAGLGVVMVDGDRRKEVSEYLGHGTNNIAELKAIERALDLVPPAERDRPIRLHTDSGYSIGVLQKGWRAKANQELIAGIKRKLARYPRLELVKVAGHAGVPENERADELAREAVARRR